jgi:hypothetical protein
MKSTLHSHPSFSSRRVQRFKEQLAFFLLCKTNSRRGRCKGENSNSIDLKVKFSWSSISSASHLSLNSRSCAKVKGCDAEHRGVLIFLCIKVLSVIGTLTDASCSSFEVSRVNYFEYSWKLEDLVACSQQKKRKISYNNRLLPKPEHLQWKGKMQVARKELGWGAWCYSFCYSPQQA